MKRLPALKISIITAVLLMLSSSVFAEDRRTDKAILVIMTFNAEFLWDESQIPNILQEIGRLREITFVP
jgi:hypothetical protein